MAPTPVMVDDQKYLPEHLENGDATTSGSDMEAQDYPATNVDPTDFDEDTFAITIVQFVLDCHHYARGNPIGFHGYTRFTLTWFLLILTVFIQVYLLSETKRYVSARSVHDIRVAYNTFEHVMYGNFTVEGWEDYQDEEEEENGTAPLRLLRARSRAHQQRRSSPLDTKDGKLQAESYFRGDPADWNASNFELFPEGNKEAVCRIPLSQPGFIGVVLFLWTMTCVQEYKRTRAQFVALILHTDRCKSMGDCFAGSSADWATNADDGVFVIQSLTLWAKGIVMCLIIVRFAVTSYLLWLGSRWLLATASFADLILNAVALEFILLIKDVIYYALAPARYMKERETVKMPPSNFCHGTVNCWQLLTVLTWFTMSLLWVVLYMHNFQNVLPEYQWDVRQICKPWIKKRFEV